MLGGTGRLRAVGGRGRRLSATRCARATASSTSRSRTRTRSRPGLTGSTCSPSGSARSPTASRGFRARGSRGSARPGRRSAPRRTIPWTREAAAGPAARSASSRRAREHRQRRRRRGGRARRRDGRPACPRPRPRPPARSEPGCVTRRSSREARARRPTATRVEEEIFVVLEGDGHAPALGGRTASRSTRCARGSVVVRPAGHRRRARVPGG